MIDLFTRGIDKVQSIKLPMNQKNPFGEIQQQKSAYFNFS